MVVILIIIYQGLVPFYCNVTAQGITSLHTFPGFILIYKKKEEIFELGLFGLIVLSFGVPHNTINTTKQY
jgi:hypothetical protein